MNQKQRDYSVQRIQSLEASKIAEVKKRFTTAGTSLGFDEKISLIRSGKVKIKSSGIDPYTKLQHAFDFSKYEQNEKIDEAKVNAAIAKIHKEAEAAKDAIMLAGDVEAISAISSFEKAIEKL